MSKALQFRRLLDSDETEFILEAHDGLSAKIVEEAGSKGIRASGLSIAAWRRCAGPTPAARPAQTQSSYRRGAIPARW